MYDHYQTAKCYSKKERKFLKEMISFKVDELLSSVMLHEVDSEICSIYKKLHGIDFRDVVADELMYMKQDIEEMFKENGMNVDFSQINIEDKEEEMVRKMYQAVDEALKENKTEFEQKPKSKRDLEKEKKALEIETLQKNGLSIIYKQLAKALHPDLELDTILKKEKEELMKQLTIAYKNEDLYTLLSLEIEWLKRFENKNEQENSNSDEQLKIYNSIFKDQIKSLQSNIKMAYFDPKYKAIQKYLADEMSIPQIKLHLEYQRALMASKEYKNMVKNLKGTTAEKAIRSILSVCFD